MNFRAVFCLLGIIFAAELGMFGCATTDNIQPSTDQTGTTAAQAAVPEGNLITGISIEETAEAIIVSITANQVLDYTLAEPPLQQSKVLYFPDSALDLQKKEYSMDNEFIGTIQAIELVKGGPSKIIIPIKSPGLACEAHWGENDNTLQLVFPRTGAGQTGGAGIRTENIMAEEAVVPVEEEESLDKPAMATRLGEEEESLDKPVAGGAATRLEKIDVLEEADQVSVKIQANGTIKTHKSFPLKNPSRIVLDLAGLTSPYTKEQRLAVNSDIVQQVRYFGHQGYVRVVIDVNQAYLSDFKVASVYNGLIVYVGNTAKRAQATVEPERPSRASAAETAPEEETIEAEQTADVYVTEPAAAAAEGKVAVGKYSQPALVNDIDFIEEQGQSTIRIGTTHPVNYDLTRTGEKKLRLTLEGANILSFRQRPLITTRFDSAVNSIFPSQTPAMKQKGISVLDINLREEVGYATERVGNVLMVRFEPSSVPPDPAQKVVIPTAGLVKTQDAGEPAVEAMTTEPVMPGETEVVLEPGAPAETLSAAEGAALPEAELPALLAGKKKVYTGEPIALEFYKTDIRNVIQILRDVSGKNFAIDEGVKGSVTLSFVNPVPWDQVLDLVLEMNHLGMVERDGIMRISTKDTILKQKESERAALAAEQELKLTEEQIAPLVTEYFSISYSDPQKDIMPHITDILTKERGHAKVDKRTKQVIMTDTQEKIDMARKIIESIDRVTPQVMINARIVETSTNFSREFGTEWAINNSPGAYRGELGGTYNYDVAMNNPAAAATNILGYNFSRIAGTPFSLDASLSLMESQGDIRIISSPRIVTLDSNKATISQGQEIPYVSISSDKATTEFKDADLKLEVTPHVTPDNRVRLEIHIEEKKVGAMIGQMDEPPLNTKEADTELLVNDGDTIVIGGIIQQTDKESTGGIPFISKIPLLGHLFKSQIRSNEKSELLIFITPTIVRLE